jgi:prolyl-tRNA editing enzyme YbaK/EbsC (Cys-tRNA(Pro) deacylase)
MASNSIERVRAELARWVSEDRVMMLASTGKSSQEAADQIGIDVGQIAKSIVFARPEPHPGVVVVTSGATRVDEDKVRSAVGEILPARADAVKAITGFSIGGVSPIGLPADVEMLIDGSLLGYEAIWPAAGHPHAVMRVTPQELVEWTGGRCGDYSTPI